jgi:NAD(P)-dependent dehydrogenase (short-subunit alcohol dehydrogenase family)
MEDRPKAEAFKGQKLPYPAKQSDMRQQPDSDLSNYRPAAKLKDKVAIITGADSGIGRAVAIAFALEGASVAITYNVNDEDAQATQQMVQDRGGTCLELKSDVRDPQACREAVERCVSEFGRLDILVNNAHYQKAQERIEDLSEDQFRLSFETNVFGAFYMIKSALPHLGEGSAIINTGSIVGMTGHELLIDYTATKGALHTLTKSLALQFGPRGIRVNAVVPGPVWTPNIPGTMPIDEVENFGHEVALGRPGQPEELAPAYVFLASEDSSFVTGSLLEVTGGRLSAAS